MTTPYLPSPSEPTLTLLFVDDEPAVTRAITRILGARPGYAIFTAASGAEALEILRTKPIDVLVSDIDMPKMTGLELVRRARCDFPRTLRILLTGAGTMDRAVNAINEGEVVRFFTKPFDLDRFVRAMGDLRESIIALRGERRAEAQQARCDQLFAWIEGRYPGTLDIARTDRGEIIVDILRLEAFLKSAPEARAFVGGA